MLMPQMDGLELVEAVRAKYPLTPVILMTAHGSEDLAIRALKKGAASYVPKQSLAQNLAETLDQVFSAAQTKVSERRILDTVMRRGNPICDRKRRPHGGAAGQPPRRATSRA